MQRHVPWTTAIPQSFLDKVVNAPVMQVCRPSKSLSWRRGSFPWSSRPLNFPQLHFNTVFDVPVLRPLVHGSNLFGAVCCLGVHEYADFLGDDIPGYFRIQRLLARQWIHVWRQFTSFRYFTHFLREGVLGSSFCSFTPAFADEEAAALVFCRLRCTSRCHFDSGMCKAVSAFHAVFPWHCGRLMLFGITVGMDQEDSFYVHKPVVVPQVQFLAVVLMPVLA